MKKAKANKSPIWTEADCAYEAGMDDGISIGLDLCDKCGDETICELKHIITRLEKQVYMAVEMRSVIGHLYNEPSEKTIIFAIEKLKRVCNKFDKLMEQKENGNNNSRTVI